VENDQLDLLAWLLSCRALGRGVEERLLAWLADRADELGCAGVRLTAGRTPRNAPARRIVAALGGGHEDDEFLKAKATPEQLRAFRSWAQPSPRAAPRSTEVAAQHRSTADGPADTEADTVKGADA
jgi:hypothetical protein